MNEKLTYEEFVKQAILKLRTELVPKNWTEGIGAF
jgi:hypothetical protein